MGFDLRSSLCLLSGVSFKTKKEAEDKIYKTLKEPAKK